ncbi:SMP-30/gluconolactonase/LRE family protein [Marinovum sp.]|uniref:SMP-30/gluconolactonase/LRE family protein n=1 Tax=Marinovum sp. TaxID=2024839 RepID=UPI002B27137F|nr:SMP-30/gluconolactonase/LRE family protein [Marinovum sp.]
MNRFDDIAERFPGAGTLVKGIQIIEILDQIGRPATSAELLAETGLPKATLYRLIGALVAFGYIRHDSRLKTYALGHRLIELAGKSMASFDLRTAAETEVLRLSKALNETVSLAVMEGDRIIYVDVRRPSNPLAIGVEIGRELPARQSASGHAILSALPPHQVNGIIGGLTSEEQSALLADFAISRARGYSIANSRTLDGVVVIAVPVNGPPGMGHGAIVVTALASRLTYERRHVIGRDLMEAARRVMGNIGSAPVSITANPRRTAHVEEGLECLATAGAIVGEGPVWDAREGVLHWVDVAAPAFHVYDPKTGEDRMAHAPYLVSAVLPSDDGRMVALTQNGLEQYDPVTHRLQTIHNPEAHLPSNRFNDAKTDSRGRVWTGSMSLDASMPSGSLYRFDRGDSARAMDGGFQVSNGLDWSPDGRTFYFTDTALGIVFAYDYDSDSGALSKRRSFLNFDPAEGKPDGLCVDSEGNLWVALWDGWRVACYGPDGSLKREIDMPVPRPTSCCFGGDDMTRLFITSASIRLPASVLEEAPLSGALFAIDVGVAGQRVNEVAL